MRPHRRGQFVALIAVAITALFLRYGPWRQRHALAIAAALEVVLVVASLARAKAARNAYKQVRRQDGGVEVALEAALAETLPRRVARLAAFELSVPFVIAQWVARRRRLPHADEHPYHRRFTPFAVALLLLSVVEGAVLTALLPWPGVRLATLLLHVWLVLWVTGFVASFATRPHVIDQNGIRIRQGPLFDERIPWDAIVRVRAVLGSDDEQPNEVALAVSGSTDIAIDLVNPRTITFRGKQRAASVLRVGVDDPQRFLASIGRHRP